MALRTFQFCVVFTIGLLASPVVSGTTTESPTSTASLNAPELSVRLWRPPEPVRVVPRGQSVTLPCTAGPQPGARHQHFLTYAWLHNDRLIDFANETHLNQTLDGSLHIPKMLKKSAAIEGKYQCVFTNKIGSVITEAVLLKLPMLSRSFAVQPSNTTAAVGETVVFRCRITSIPEATIRWEHNSKPVNSSRSRYIQLPNGSLMVYEVETADAGNYSCIATNKYIKSMRRSSADLTVNPATKILGKPELATGNESQVIVRKMGETASLYCLAKHLPRPLVRWELPYNSTLNINISTKNALYLHNVSGENARTYTCIAYNEYGNSTQKWSVHLAPYFIETPTSTHVPPAKTVRLNCTVGGWPPPVVTWLKDGNPIKWIRDGKEFRINGRITIKADMLVLADTVTSDSGLYECIATNEAGESRSVARVLIRTLQQRLPPPPPPSKVLCRSFSPYSICLTWNPPPQYVQKIQAYTIHYMPSDGGPEQQNTTNETHWLVESLMPNTNYTFYLRAYIREAASEQSFPVICRGGVVVNRTVLLEAEGPEVLHVKWTALMNDAPCGELAQYKVQWRRPGHLSNSAKHVGGDVFEYKILDLNPAQTYEVRIMTSISSGDDDVPWLSITMPNNSLPSASKSSASVISHLEAIPTSSNSINVTWESTRPDNDDDFDYFLVCYTEENSMESCDDGGTYVKSATNGVAVTGLRPYTVYKFQVKIHDQTESYGNFSHLVECRTAEGVPSQVRNLDFKLLNKTSNRVEWQSPSQINGILRNYSVYYTSDLTLPIDQWNNITVAPNKYHAELTDLKSNTNYNVIVYAETNAGKGKPANLTMLSFLPPYMIDLPGPSDDLHKPEHVEPEQDRTVGIVIGLTIAGLCVLCCVSYIVCYRRCIKSNLNAHRQTYASRSLNSTNGHQTTTSVEGVSIIRRPVIIHDTVSEGSISVPMGESTAEIGEAHEMQCLVLSNDAPLPPHIPPIVSIAHLDTKGGTSYPNGHVNGYKCPLLLRNGRIANGIVRITENPQYDSGAYDESESPVSNNNSSDVNYREVSLLFDDTVQADDFDDTFSPTLNSTQLTSLENSSVASRRISPVIGPNG